MPTISGGSTGGASLSNDTPAAVAVTGAAGVGTDGSRSDHAHAGSFVLVGSSTTEQTTASTSAVDLVTISGLSIPATTPIMITGNFRKTSGAATRVGVGLKINSTVVGEASAASATVALSGATDEAQNGGFQVIIMPRRANYQGGAFGFYNQRRNGTSTGNAPAADADIPTDTITSIALRAISGNASVTMGVSDVYVYAMGA